MKDRPMRKIYRRVLCSDSATLAKRDKELAEQLQFSQNILDAIAVPVFYKDKEGRYQGCNRAFEEYLGRSRMDIVGKNVYELSPQELAARYEATDRELFNNPGKQVYESSVMGHNNLRRDVLFNKATYHDACGEVAGLVGIITDITERKRFEAEFQLASSKLETALEQTVQAMATISEARDLYTAGHQQRVSQLAVAIASVMKLAEEQITAVRVAGLLHDIGKIAIPSEVLTKPAKLSFYEYEIVKEHAKAGYDILRKIDFPGPIAKIVHQHHERLDGSGYPRGLKGPDILLEAQIVAVADVVEAMASHRPYRPSRGIVEAICEINRHRGSSYDDRVVAACIEVFERGFVFKTPSKEGESQ